MHPRARLSLVEFCGVLISVIAAWSLELLATLLTASDSIERLVWDYSKWAIESSQLLVTRAGIVLASCPARAARAFFSDLQSCQSSLLCRLRQPCQIWIPSPDGDQTRKHLKKKVSFCFFVSEANNIKITSNNHAIWCYLHFFVNAWWGEFIDLMKHSTPFENGKENGVIGDVSSWVHYNWPEAHISEWPCQDVFKILALAKLWGPQVE